MKGLTNIIFLGVFLTLTSVGTVLAEHKIGKPLPLSVINKKLSQKPNLSQKWNLIVKRRD